MTTTRVRPEADKALGWAFRPDSDTVASLNRGKSKLKDFNSGADRPHFGGNLAEELVEAKKAEDKRRRKGIRRRKMAKKVQRSAKRTAVSSKKKTVEAKSSGKLIPLKTICAELDLDPKATRVRLRRMIAKGEIDFHESSQRWEFTKAQKAVIVEALS